MILFYLALCASHVAVYNVHMVCINRAKIGEFI